MVEILNWVNQYPAPIWLTITIILAVKPWAAKAIDKLWLKNKSRINKKIERYTELKSNPNLFYSEILKHVLVSFCVMGIAVAFDSMFQMQQQMALVYSWRMMFGFMLYAVALNGIISMRIINSDFDITINQLKERLKKIEVKNN